MDYKVFNFKEYCKNICKNGKKKCKEKCKEKCETLLIDFFSKIDEEKNQEIIFRILRS